MLQHLVDDVCMELRPLEDVLHIDFCMFLIQFGLLFLTIRFRLELEN